MLDKTNWVSWN